MFGAVLAAALMLPAPQPAESIVFVSGANRLNVVDVATGEAQSREMKSLAACGPELVVDEGRVVFAGMTRRQTTVMSLPLSLEGRPLRLGNAHAFVPSAAPGRVWLAGTTCTVAHMTGARELTVDGTETVASTRRLPRGWLAAAVPSGLVLVQGRRPRVWSPQTGRLGARLPLDGVEDAHGNLLAGCALHARCHRFAVVDSRSGNRRALRPPRGYTPSGSPQFSPDGSLVAFPVVRGRRWALALGSGGGGQATLVPGSRTGRVFPSSDWSRSSGRLLFRAPGGLVKAYVPGSSRATQTEVRIEHRGPFAVG